MAFVHLKKAFHHVPRCVIWWALRKLGIEEGLVLLIQSLYENARSRFCFGCNLSEVLSMKVGVHQGFCLSPLLFTVLEALTKEFRTGCPWENLYEDDLVTFTESLGELQEKLSLWNTNMEGKGLQVNMGETKLLISGPGLHVLEKSGNDICAVCLKGIGTNSIFCGEFSSWVHKKCSGIPGSGLNGIGQAGPVDCRGHSGYGEAWGGAIRLLPQGLLILRWWLWTHFITRCCVAWGKFNEHLSILSFHSFPITSRWRDYNSCIRSARPMQSKPGPQYYLTYSIACNAMTEVWSAGCTVSPPRTKSAHKIIWSGCSLMIRQRYSNSDGTAM